MLDLIKKYLYGDYGDKENAGTNGNGDSAPPPGVWDRKDGSWPLWEVFVRSKQGLDHKHVGSLHAADAQMAIENARDVYTRRQEGISIWVVESIHIHASNPADADSLYDPANDKVYRYPTFYELPDELKHM
jgi:ring-1,2-phenylacetyl-CoA epoxidase subunit PaaB